jgi:nicotinic acid mononucleotide adenylyltransferase
VLDLENRYTDRYYRRFNGREEALEYVFERSSFIVASRAGAGLENVRLLVESQSNVPRDRILYLDFPPDLGELSATEVRNRCRAGVSISELVPALVEQFISQRELYRS